MRYLLLPFSHGIDAVAIEQAISLAHEQAATLVALSIICLSGHQHRARLEYIQQSKDFLTLVEHKAARAGIPIDTIERFTCHEVQVIREVAQELHCQGILLFVRQQKGVLLSATTIQQLMQNSRCPCFLSMLPPQRHFISTMRDSFGVVYDVMRSRAAIAHI